MFLVCEPIAWGLEHVPFNAALLKTIHYAFPDERIKFHGEHSHIEEVKKEIGEELLDHIEWCKISLSQRHASFFKRLSSDFSNVRYLLNELNDNVSKNVLVIIGNPSILWALKYHVSTSHKNSKVQVVLHGDFSKLRYRSSLKNIFNPLYHIGSLKTALRISTLINFQIIVLEDAVRDAVIKEMPSLQRIIKVLDHPIPGDSQPLKIIELNEPIQFGFLGRASESKGFLEFLSAASEISRRFPGKANFHLIGWILDYQQKQNIPEIKFLTDKPATHCLNRTEYVKRLGQLHFVCMFYRREYEFTASGVLLDSVKYEKPIITTPLPIFEHLNNRFSNIGYLCHNDNMVDMISSIISKLDTSHYKQQVQNMRQLKNSRTPVFLAKKYYELTSLLLRD